jgi:hypothetical protein
LIPKLSSHEKLHQSEHEDYLQRNKHRFLDVPFSLSAAKLELLAEEYESSRREFVQHAFCITCGRQLSEQQAKYMYDNGSSDYPYCEMHNHQNG